MAEFDGEDFVVLYGWEPENDGDLKLIAGESVLVVEKNEHGWWNGIIQRDNVPHKGYFPKNYVRPKSIVSAPRPPPRPSLNDSAVEKLEEDLAKTNMSAQYNSRKSLLKQGPSFSLKTLSAFDELMDFGVAVELELPVGTTSTSTGAYISNGMRVDIKIQALLWDGASSVIEEFASGPVSFTVGCGQVTKGLNMAMLRLRVNDTATITCSPSNAYGEAGNPPVVPPDSFIVYRLTILSATAPRASVASGGGSGAVVIPAAVGPAAILGSGVSASRFENAVPFSGKSDVDSASGKTLEKRKSRIMLVYNATKESSGEDQNNKLDDDGVPLPPTLNPI